MQSVWLKGCKDEEARKKRTQEVLSYRNAFDDLSVVLSSMYPEYQATDYDNPSWSHKQAHQNGEREAIKRVLSLINIQG